MKPLKTYFLNCYNSIMSNILEELKCDSPQFKKIIQSCLILLAGMLVCAFWSFFVYIEICLFTLFVFINCKSAKAVYYCIFLMPFVLFFRGDNWYFYDSSRYVYISVVLALGGGFLVDIFKRKIKLNWIFTLSYLVLFIHMVQPWEIFDCIRNIELPISLILLFVIFHYRKEVDIKEIIYIFTISLLGSCFIGVFQPLSPRMNEILPNYFTETGELRFHGCGATNILASELVIGISLILYLHLKGEIRYLAIICLIPMEIALFSTYSKLGLISFLIVLFLYIIMYTIKNRKVDYSFYIIVGWMLFILIVNVEQINVILERLFGQLFNFESNNYDSLNGGMIPDVEIPPNDNVQDLIPDHSIPDNVIIPESPSIEDVIPTPENNGNSIIDSITTGRFGIWKRYTLSLFDSINIFLFGHGAYMKNLVWGNLSSEGITPHNMYLYYLNRYGFVFILLISIVVFTILKKERFKLDFSGIMPIFAVLICMLSEDFMYYELFVIILICCFVLFIKKPSEKGVVKKIEYDTQSYSLYLGGRKSFTKNCRKMY